MSAAADLATTVAAFIYREARLLDERRFEEWRDLFAADGVYWVPARAEQTDPLHEVSIFYDDPVMMAARIRRLRHPRMHAEIPRSRAVRSVTNIEVLPAAGEGLVEARSVLVMTEFRSGRQTAWHGRVAWRLVPAAAGDFRIRLKRVDLVNAEGMHHGMTVPF
ncbi:MAG TPA: aromatic-ring-hydroxylating dioxygenase subunit beta [Alphaproteobacteria bacterium]|jgi:benzoate/toluate 1,2-dioxygenase beta subunit